MSQADRNSTKGGFLSRAWEATKAGRERHALRMAAPYLLSLDDDQLKDVGYSRNTLRSLL